MAPYAPNPHQAEGRCVDPRDIERDALARKFLLKLPQALARNGHTVSAIAPSAIGRSTAGTGITDRWPALTRMLHSRGSPAAFWKRLVELEPALEQFSFGGRLSRDRIIARCTIILENRALWSTALGLNVSAMTYIDGVVRDVLALMGSLQGARRSARAKPRLTSWQYTWTDLRCCDLCWHLVPAGSQEGFHGHRASEITGEMDRFRFRGNDALCADHKPSLGNAARARWKRDQRFRDVIQMGGREGAARWHLVTPEAIAAGAHDILGWSKMMAATFPLVACAHPFAAAGLSGALHELSGLPPHAIETLIEAVPDHAIDASIVVIGMLATCETILAHERHRRIGGNLGADQTLAPAETKRSRKLATPRKSTKRASGVSTITNTTTTPMPKMMS